MAKRYIIDYDDVNYFMEHGHYPKIEICRTYTPPTEDNFDEMDYLETNYDTFFEPSRRYHFYSI